MRGITMSVIRGKRETTEKGTKYIIIRLLRGAAIGSAAFFLLLLLLAQIILKSDLGDSVLTAAAMASAGIAALVSGFFAVRPIRKNGIPLGAASVIPVIAVTALCCAVAAGGIGKNLLYSVVLMLVCGAVGGIGAVNMRKKGRTGRR